jgi:hypothetical protein
LNVEAFNEGTVLGQSFFEHRSIQRRDSYKLLAVIRQNPMTVQDSAARRCLDELHANIEFKEVFFSIHPARTSWYSVMSRSSFLLG